MITLVSGPSCVGKSTFVARNGLGDRVVFAASLNKAPLPTQDAVVHHCLLRGGDKSPLVPLLEKSRVERAVVLVSPLTVLLHRASRRHQVEPVLRPKWGSSYDGGRWVRKLTDADLTSVYSWWFGLLEHRGIRHEIFDSSDRHYRRLEVRQVPGLLAS